MEKAAAKNRARGRSVAYDILKDAIQYLELAPSSVLVESELMTRTGLGRTPIREALIRLSEEVLVNIFPQSGTYVAPISFEFAREVAHMRYLLERDVCLALCREKARIRDALDEQFYFMRTAVKRKDVAGYIRHGNNLHGVIFKHAGHEVMWNIISGSRAHYNRVLMLVLKMPGRLDASYWEHEQLVACIESGDAGGLEHILETHHVHTHILNARYEEEKEIRQRYPEYFN